jgi:hypothetical protein
MGLGRRYLQWGCWHASTMVLSFAVGIRWGVLGLTIAYAWANLIAALPSVWFCTHNTPISPLEFLKVHFLPGAFALAAAVGSALTVTIWPPSDHWTRLAIGTAAFALIYLSQFALFASRLVQFRSVVAALTRRRAASELLAA